MVGVEIQVADGQDVTSTVMVDAAAKLQISVRGVEERIYDMVIEHEIQQSNAEIVTPGRWHRESRKTGLALHDIGAQVDGTRGRPIDH